MAKKYLDEVTYLPNTEYEVTVTADKNKGKQKVSLNQHKRLNEEQWQEYWGNQGAAAVNNARSKFARTVMPYALSFVNPAGLVPTVGGIVGSEIGGYVGEKIDGTRGQVVGSILGGMAGGVGSTRKPYDIARNIKNRNMFAYKYISPAGYDRPISRAKQFLYHILHDEDLPNVDSTPTYEDVTGTKVKMLGELGQFRDAAWRKYLGLSEKDKLYIPNGDGTYSYDMDYVQKRLSYNPIKRLRSGVIDDPVGNGGSVNATGFDFGPGIGSDFMKHYGVQRIRDVWDLHPFSRTRDRVDRKIINYVAHKADNLYKKLYPIYKNNFNYNYLGGRFLNKLRYGDYDKQLTSIVKPISDKIANFEIGPIIKGKPFEMRTDIPITETYGYVEGATSPEGFTEIIPNHTYEIGINGNNILPQGYFDYKAGNYTSPYIRIVPKLKNGGIIHIKPENRGKFNATKKRTGKTTEELTHSKNPLTRKRAIFAQNARKWKH